MKKVIIHVGTEKTGTTYLQKTMEVNRRLLKRLGMLYPRAGLESSHHYWVAKALGFKYKKGPIDEGKERQALMALEREISEWNGVVLLSSEHFNFSVTTETLQNLARFFSGVKLEVVLVLRNQIDYSQSLFCEGIKWGLEKGYADFVLLGEKRGRYDYRKMCEEWGGVSGKVNVIDYEEKKGELLAEFLRAIGVDSGVGKIVGVTGDFNPTPSVDLLELMRRAALDNDHGERRMNYESFMRQLSNRSPDLLRRRCFSVPEKVKGVFIKAEESNFRLAGDLGLDEEKFLGGGLQARMQEYEKYGPPDPFRALQVVAAC